MIPKHAIRMIGKWSEENQNVKVCSDNSFVAKECKINKLDNLAFKLYHSQAPIVVPKKSGR